MNLKPYANSLFAVQISDKIYTGRSTWDDSLLVIQIDKGTAICLDSTFEGPILSGQRHLCDHLVVLDVE